jgi:hypothetical protein
VAVRIFKSTSTSLLEKEEQRLRTKIELTETKLQNNRISLKAKQIYSEHITDAQDRLRKVRGEFALRKPQK